MNSTSQPRQERCQMIRRWNSISATNASPIEAKLAYIKLNIPAPCPPRSVVLVNPGAWFGEFVSTQHAEFAFINVNGSVPSIDTKG